MTESVEEPDDGAIRWFKNGDHPRDYAEDTLGFENGELRTFTGAERQARGWEGDVVRYFRHLDVAGTKICAKCKHTMHAHGWIDDDVDGKTVCPGDFVSKDV